MNRNSVTGSFTWGPFEKVRTSMYMMSLGLLEASFVDKLLDDPKKIDTLCTYLLTDPSIKDDSNLPN